MWTLDRTATGDLQMQFFVVQVVPKRKEDDAIVGVDVLVVVRADNRVTTFQNKIFKHLCTTPHKLTVHTVLESCDDSDQT